jgi:hypothetical protein
MKKCDVAVIGAGPYGLSVTAHLRARGVDAFAFGKPMSFWEHQMPVGMLLRSPTAASSLSDAEGKLTISVYREGSGMKFSAPIPREHFVDYGIWFQRQTAPDVDTREVPCIQKNGAFHLSLEDGEQVAASRVVVAAGIGSFPARPEQFAGLPGALVSHSCEHRDFSSFRGRKVAVIGGGQSALESAALLYEAGAEVEVIVREPQVRWLQPTKWAHSFKPLERLLFAPYDVGPAGVSQLVARPDCFRMLPRGWQDRWGVRSIRPAGAAWLLDRVKHVTISAGRVVETATRAEDRLQLTLDDGSSRLVDHVLLATGYRVDISRYRFLAPQLLAAIDTVKGYPKLNSGFESSVPGLYFVGATAAWSFGPLMRFVAGTDFTARTVTKGILANRS